MDSQQQAHTVSENKDHGVAVSVNEQPVRLHGAEATGTEIKAGSNSARCSYSAEFC